MWFVNHTNRQKVGFVWLPVLRYAVIFHTRLCTAVISRCFYTILIFFLKILHGFRMVINSHTCHIMTLYDYQFSFYGKVPGNFKMPLFILVCLWAIELTYQKLILFAVLVSFFEPLREWLIFYRGWNLMGIAHYAIRLVVLCLSKGLKFPP